MSRPVVATPLFARHLKAILDEYAELGAVRFVDRLRGGYRNLVENVSVFEEMAPARRRRIGGKTVTVREYLLDAGARTFLLLYWVPSDPSEPVLLLNIRIGGQNRFRWTEVAGPSPDVE
ncbi:MAG: hypothetical protein A4E69_02783 [Syntrophus sp. PtaB.Bin138]|nr:MAG: hypothetical protein A4E69_02783 [Syntrophus sp. PtaB.Bin138]